MAGTAARRLDKRYGGGILNRARRIALTRAFGAAFPARKRARRIISGAERDILTSRSNWTLTFDPLPYKAREEIRAG